MQQFAEIFSKKLQAASNFAGVPVGCAIREIYQTQQQLLTSAQTRQQMIQQKNEQIAANSMQYRETLQQKIDLMQAKHKKNREAQLTKIRKNQEHKIKCVQEIQLKHTETEKKQARDRLKQLRERQIQTQNYWSQQKTLREKSHRTQSAAKPLYSQAFELKKAMESRNEDFGMRVRSQLVRKHKGRQMQVLRGYEKKREEILEPHKSQIQKNLNKYKEIVADHQSHVVNSIGTHFASSAQVLKQKRKQWQNKYKARLIDDEMNRQTVRSNLTERIRNRSSSLADCRCKRINNVEEGLTKSIALTEKHRSSLFTDTLRSFKKAPSPVVHQRSQFLSRSQSLRSTVSNNKEAIEQRRYILETERLQREREITAAIELKKSIEVEGNCYVRLLNVK